jgi:protein-L-isoaspartate(D-aspartate) O-methyltransferase
MPETTLAHQRDQMVEHQLLARRVDPRVAEAMRRVPREEFFPASAQEFTYDDAPHPIGEGQTISQPYIVAMTCQYAKVRPGDKVLDVGTGSGYQAAVLAELGARVHSIERIPALVASARANLARAGYDDVVVHQGDGSLGLPAEAPFAAIVCAAAAPELPAAYRGQLLRHGRAIAPVGDLSLQRLIILVNRPSKPTLFATAPVRFVPMIGAQGYNEEDAS